MTALVSGSVILTGRLCRCGGAALVWAWDLASVDADATAAVQAKADQRATAKAKKAAKAKRTEGDEGDDHGDVDQEQPAVSAPPVRPVRRPAVEALGMLGIGGGLVAGAVATVWPLVAPHLAALAAWRGVIASAVTLAWMAAAWMVAPAPPAAPVEEDQEAEENQEAEEDQEEAASPADLLARHVLGQLAELEAAGRRGVHVTALIASAEEAGLLQLGAMDKTAMRAWLPASGIPVTKSVKVRGDVDFGLSVAHVTAALGMSPGEALRRLSGEAPETPVEAPSGEAPETPVEGAPEAPAPAPVEALPPARLALVKPLPEEEAESGARGAA
ncbi:hypothetical protein C0Q98_31765 [Streptomyces albidoflavus]|nr:hypothetical protein C0Q98_31765 [Streptomyces albidoflavus]